MLSQQVFTSLMAPTTSRKGITTSCNYSMHLQIKGGSHHKHAHYVAAFKVSPSWPSIYFPETSCKIGLNSMACCSWNLYYKDESKLHYNL